MAWPAVLAFAACAGGADKEPDPRPNILWLTSEDNGPQLGCYGDPQADTPNLDQLAARGLLYQHCWSNAPVCAPARTAIISGMYPTATGAEHMRSMTRLPAAMRMYPAYLRDAGYYCTNNSKEDYNLAKVGVVWDESSPKAHYKNRRQGQPFFAVFNFTSTHESQVRARPHTPRHDPAKARVPAYHPDHPAVRRDWAQYYDKMTEMDAQVGKALRELDDAGLADSTIVFYYGDHGPGMPRCKRWPMNSGLHVPLLLYVPEKFAKLRPPEYKAGGQTTRLVGFVDLAPTVLSLAGVTPPEHLHGRAFAGPSAAQPNRYLHGFRGRMDERVDLARSVRDERYVYVRHYMPHLPFGQHVAYMFQTPTTRVWKELYDAGRLNAAQSQFWQAKPVEQLFDLQNDPDEVHNLADAPEHQETLRRFREEQRAHALRVRDVGFLPEDEIHSRARGTTPWEMAQDDARYPLERVLAAAEIASDVARHDTAACLKLLADDDSAVRYWGAVGARARGARAFPAAAEPLLAALDDSAGAARVAAAAALALHGPAEHAAAALAALVEHADQSKHGPFVAAQALNALDHLGEKAHPAREQIKKLPRKLQGVDGRQAEYVPRLLEHILGE